MPEYGSNPGYNTTRGAAQDMYSDSEGSEESHEKPGEKEDHGQTALIPKSLCPDMKPGEEVVLKIERGLEDQWEVSYAPKKEGEEHEEEPEGPVEKPASAPEGGMGSMYD